MSCLFLISFFSFFFFSLFFSPHSFLSLNYFSPAFTLVSCKFLSFFFRLNFSFTWLASLYFVCCYCVHSPCFSWPLRLTSLCLASFFCPGLQSQLSHGGCIVSVLFFFALFGLVSVAFGRVYFYGSLCRFCASFLES